MGRFRLAWIQIRSQLGQLSVAIIVIALGVALSAGMLLANAALRDSFENSIDAMAGRADLVVSPLSGGTLDEAILDTVRSVEGVEAAAPLLLGDGFIEGENPIRVRIVGVDMLDDATVRVYDRSPAEAAGVSDPLLFLSQQDSIIAPQRLLERLQLKKNDALSVMGPAGRRSLVARGVLSDAGLSQAFGGDVLVMDLEAAQTFLALPARLSQIDVRMNADSAPSAVAASLRTTLAPHLAIDFTAKRRRQLTSSVDAFQAMLNVIALIGLVLGALITSNRLATTYQQRLWEVGVLRGLGWSPRLLMSTLLVEAAVLSLLGCGLGLPLGVVFANFIVAPVGDTLALNLRQSILTPSVRVQVLPLALASGAGLFAGVVSAGFPAWRAASVEISQLRADKGRRAPSPIGQTRRRTTASLIVVAVVSLILQEATAFAPFGWIAILTLPCVGILLVRPSLEALGPPLGALLGDAAAIGLRDQGRAPGRAVGAAVVLFVGVGLVAWVGTTGNSFEQFVTNTVSSVSRAHLVVDGAVGELDTGQGSQRLSGSILVDLSAVPGVRAVSGEAVAVSGADVGILAVDASRLTDPDLGGWVLATSSLPDAIGTVTRGEGVLVDPQVLRNKKASIGSPFQFQTPAGPVILPIVGIVRTYFLSPNGTVVIERSLYEKLWGDHSVSRAFVALEEEADAPLAKREIVDRIGDKYRIRIVDRVEYDSWTAQSVRRGFAFLDAMVVLTVFVVFLGTVDGLAANVIERTREIGSLRSLGYSGHDMASMVVGQALAIGVVGACLAVLIGFAMSLAFVGGVLPDILGWDLEIYPDYRSPLIAAALGVLACLVGALVPALRASRMPIASALRYE